MHTHVSRDRHSPCCSYSDMHTPYLVLSSDPVTAWQLSHRTISTDCALALARQLSHLCHKGQPACTWPNVSEQVWMSYWRDVYNLAATFSLLSMEICQIVQKRWPLSHWLCKFANISPYASLLPQAVSAASRSWLIAETEVSVTIGN